MSRKKILSKLEPAESYRFILNESINELKDYNLRLSIHQAQYKDFEFKHIVSFDKVEPESLCLPYLNQKPYAKNGVPPFLGSRNNSIKKPFGDFSSSYWLTHDFQEYSEYVKYEKIITDWETDKILISENFKRYQESGDLFFLLQIQQTINSNKEQLCNSSKSLKYEVRSLRKKLISPYQEFKLLILKKLIWFHLKRQDINSDDDAENGCVENPRLFFTVILQLKRISYELFRIRKGNYSRQIEFCYLL